MLAAKRGLRKAVSFSSASIVSRRSISASVVARGESTGKSVNANDLPIPGFRKSGETPKDWELATGQERYELLTKLQGQTPWLLMEPIVLSSKPTTKNPVILRGDDPEQYIGCTGFPADSHEVVWLTVREHKGFDRCPHCGNVFKYTQNHHH